MDNQKEIEKVLLRYNLFGNEKAEKVLKENWMTPKQIEECKSQIITSLRGDKIPSQNPIVMIVGGQSGSGKTALMSYTSLMSNNREFVIIDNDFFRGFHPNAVQIRKDYPEFYTSATEQLGGAITPDIISYFAGNNQDNTRYNIILHQTLATQTIADNAMKDFRNLGYTVGLRVFAVPYIESLMSQIERCTAQYLSLGSCRYVDLNHHLNSINGILNTVDYIDKNNIADFIEIFARTQDIARPECVYAKFNEQNIMRTQIALSNCGEVNHENYFNGFSSPVEAIKQTREIKTNEALDTLGNRIDEVKQLGANEIPGMSPYIMEAENFLKFHTTQENEVIENENINNRNCN